MSVTFKKMFFACIVALMVLTTGAWQNAQPVFAEKQDVPEVPLFFGLTWGEPVSATRNLTVNMNGDAVALTGQSYQASERFAGDIPQVIVDYYSNAQLAKSGWVSYDAFDGADGVHRVFEHASGVYLSVEFVSCSDDSSSTCVVVWMSGKTDPSQFAQFAQPDSSETGPTATSFNKTSPTNNTINLDPKNLTLTWGAHSPTPDKYSYCVKAGGTCEDNDPNWTGTYLNTSIKLTNLDYDKLYYWQIKAITCGTCIPKKYVYANGGTWWTFTTKPQSAARGWSGPPQIRVHPLPAWHQTAPRNSPRCVDNWPRTRSPTAGKVASSQPASRRI